MEIINRQKKMAAVCRRLKYENKTIALVPTMGALHDGHLSLVKKAHQLADIVIVSIFVNPAQFNEQSDLDKYPRDLTTDASLLANYQVNYIYAPDSNDIYGDGYSTYVTVDELSNELEGASRPGHFRGVATIVTILFNTITPNFALFGQKDAQQASIIKKLTTDLAFNTEIVIMPIVREENGLAMSSRNELLTKEQRNAASIIYESLQKAKIAVETGELNTTKITEIVCKSIEGELSAIIDYVAIVNNNNLQPIEKIEESTVLIAVAVKFGEVRLIDNIKIDQ